MVFKLFGPLIFLSIPGRMDSNSWQAETKIGKIKGPLLRVLVEQKFARNKYFLLLYHAYKKKKVH